MAGWFLIPYTQFSDAGGVYRQADLGGVDVQIKADGGWFSEIEVLGDTALLKVGASDATLALLNAVPGVTRIPLAHLDDPMSSLSAGVRTAIKNKILALGYTLNEVQTALGVDLSTVTLGQVLRFVATRRLTPRQNAGTIVCDGAVLPCASVDGLDARIP